jgi:transcriptional regulator with XRE-family HTH domain
VATIGTKIREARKAAGFKNAESFAVELGVGIRSIQRWESDETTPSIERLLQIGRLTGKPLSYFIEGAEAVA